MEVSDYLASCAHKVDLALDAALPGASVKPSTIHRAMRYSIFAGGKRLRPALTLAACEACGADDSAALPLACAVECIHTYSLIHDDLPCMDDDDLRRGRPTSHKVFGEGIAVLAGDALLTEAFQMVASAAPARDYPVAEFVKTLADAAGSRMLIAGQVADLEAENHPTSRAQLRFIHERKTSALIRASLRLGGLAANAPAKTLAVLDEFGNALGIAFQVVDDILDVTASHETLGKTAGKDAAAGKATYPAVLGLDASRRAARRLTRKALSALDPLGIRGENLAKIASHLLDREF